MTAADVLIVGAGFAGLAAAEKLGAAGLNVITLEARDRLGGRAHSLSIDGHVVELGAEFVHGEPLQIVERIRRFGLTLQERSGKHWRRENDGSFAPCGFPKEVQDFLGCMGDYKGPDTSFAEYLDSQKPIQPHIEEWLVGYVEGFNAAEKERISVRWLIAGDEASDRINGDRLLVIQEGYSALANAMASALPRNVRVLTGKKVKTLDWSRASVTAEVEGSSWTARAALVTLPVSLLQSDDVMFTPALPLKRQAASKLVMGSATRVSFNLSQWFWLQPMPDLCMLHADDPSFPILWTMHPENSPILTTWAGGPRAIKLSRLSGSQIIAEGVQAAARCFQLPVDELHRMVRSAYTFNWQQDPFSKGSYAYVTPGNIQAVEQLAAPVENTIFFAGEATNMEGRGGTVDGAISTGERAATEIIKVLRG